MKEFVTHHPYLTFFLGLAALGTIGAIVSPPVTMAAVPPPPPPKATLTSGILAPSMFTPVYSKRPAHG